MSHLQAEMVAGAKRMTVKRGLVVALLLAVVTLAVGVASAFADAGNPILNTIKANAVDNGDGTVTVYVRGQWNWLSHNSDCNFDRAATGVGIVWSDRNGADSTRTATTATHAGTTVTLTTSTAQAFAVGDQITVSGVVGGGGYNGDFVITARDNTHVKYTSASASGSGSGGTVTDSDVFNGWLVSKNGINAYIGTQSATTAGTHANPVDRMVHPVDRGNVPEGYTTAGSDYPTGQLFADPAVPDPNSYLAWKGGCGREPITDVAPKGSHPEKINRNCATDPASTVCAGHPWGSWGYEKTGGATVGYSHTYLKTLPNGMSGLPDRVCVNFYDVHGGGTGTNLQKVNGANEITVDANGDNSIETNAFDVTNGANCVNVDVTAVTTQATSATIGSAVHDTATLTGPAGAAGTITFKVYGPRALDSTTANCDAGNLKNTFTVPVAGPGTYDGPDFTATATGKYDWTASFQPDNPLVLTASSPCGADGETSTIAKASPMVTTDAGPTVALVNGSASLADAATLSEAYNPTGTITFKLYSDANCTVQEGGTKTKTVSGNGSYLADAIVVKTAGTYHWIANYSGDDNNNPTTNGCNAANENVRVINPGILISKDPNDQTILNGGTATFTITVSNTGDSTLTNVHVTDALAAGCAKTAAEIAAIPPHSSSTFAPGASVTYQCTMANVTASFTNTAIATGTPTAGPDVTDQDTANVLVINPSIAIAKTPDTQTVVSGSTVTFSIKVTNTGDTTLTNVTVTDAQSPGCAKNSADIAGLASMAPQAEVTYECTKPNATASFTNSATATGTPPVGPDVTAADTADVTVIHPHISVAKSPETQTIVTGSTATFTIDVTNDGDATLTNVRVTDDLSPGCAKTSADISGLASMAPGAKVSYQCTKANVTASFTNSATATGTPPVGADVTATDTADVAVIGPHISVTKSPKSQTILSGGTATFTIEVTNDGDVALTNVRVTDAQAPGCAKTSADVPGLASMAPGAKVSYQCTKANVTASFTNSATATGTPPVGADVTATDTAAVTVIHPSIAVTKSPSSQTIASGGTATFTITVTNTGDVTLTNVRVTDALAPGCARTSSDIAGLASMAPGAKVSYDCTLANVTAGFTNTATATGTPPVGPDVAASDNAVVTVTPPPPPPGGGGGGGGTPAAPAISIVKSPASQTISAGGTASFSITVRNTGDVQLTNVTVADALSADCARTIGTLAAGASSTYTCTRTNVTESFTNVAVATGTPPSGPNVTATSSAQVTVTPAPAPAPAPFKPPAVKQVAHPAISIVKDPKSQTVAHGGTATFTITVTNTGDVTLSKVTVADSLSPNCKRAFGTLAPGDSRTYTCTRSHVTASFTNVAVATGKAPNGKKVSGRDTAPVKAKAAPFKPPVPKVVSHAPPKATG